MSSADMLKVATLKLIPTLKELDAKVVMFIHDEIVFDVPEGIGKKGLDKIAEVMCSAVKLNGVDIETDIEAGKKWGQVMADDEIDAFFKNIHEN